MPDARLVAADARPDLVGTTSDGLGRQERIADQGARHRARVGLPQLDHPLGLVGLVDPAGDHDRDAHDRLHPSRHRGRVGVRHVHRRRDVVRTGERRRAPRDHADVVEPAVAIERGERRQHLVAGEPVVADLVGGDAQARDEAPADFASHRRDGLAQEPQPILIAAPVAVCPQVDPGVEELGREVAVAGDDLDAVEAGLLQPPRGRPEAGDDLLDELDRHGARHHVEPLVGDHGRCQRHRQRAVLRLHDLAAAVEELAEDSAPMGVDGVGEPAESRDARVVRRHQHVRGVARGLVHPGDLDHDQPDAACCPRLVVGHEPVRDPAVLGHHRVVPG